MSAILFGGADARGQISGHHCHEVNPPPIWAAGREPYSLSPLTQRALKQNAILSTWNKHFIEDQQQCFIQAQPLNIQQLTAGIVAQSVNLSAFILLQIYQAASHASRRCSPLLQTLGVSWSVCRCVCLLVKRVRPAKTAEPTEIPFWTDSCGQGEQCVRRGCTLAGRSWPQGSCGLDLFRTTTVTCQISRIRLESSIYPLNWYDFVFDA